MGLKPVSVSQLNSYIKRILQTDPILGNVSVIGEISNLKFHGSGHVYFSLKDNSSTVSCFLPSDRVNNIPFELTEGLEVTVHGYLYLYERGGRYSINVRDMEESGEGKLMAEFRRLQKKLEAKGLFRQDIKKEIPLFPSKVAIVTSETGAAVRDIIKIITTKNNYVDILICPVIVQGPKAAEDISSAINMLNEKYNDIDVMIVGRGGGSMEDLWPFNEEIVAYSIYNSRIPVVSAVGHEIDFTISDFVADLRTETPTAAADIVVPNIDKLKDDMSSLVGDMKLNLKHRIQIYENKLENMNPINSGKNLKARIGMDYMHCDNLMDSIINDTRLLLNELKRKIDNAGNVIHGANPDLILSRGYTLIRDENNQIIDNVNKLNIEDEVSINFASGNAKAKVLSIKE